ncbi:MAG TPA: gliding motility-associated C-terminal domain-containing protein, partial [Flavobacteriales bacterium]|nr:gliding motility-associated C-terminal domain-containing protein [Flavobacteriales bacterium]
YDSFQWSTNEQTASISVEEGSYTVSAQYLNCIYTSAPFSVTEIVPPPVFITGDSVICMDGVAFLSATAGFDSYYWQPGGATGINVNFQLNGDYIVTASLNGCTAVSPPFHITTLPLPVPEITGPGFACGAQPAVLSTTVPFASYQWSNGPQTATDAVGTGSYTVTVTDANGCNGLSAPYNVLLGSSPNAAFTIAPPSPQPTGTTADFTDASSISGGTITGWNWSFGNTGNSTDPDPSWSFPDPGVYAITLLVTANDGCTDSVTVDYTIFPPDITIPNVISPNGDNQNDYLVIQNILYWNNELTIYSRWGNKVFETTNYKNQWKAQDLPDGTYYYVLILNKNKEYSGHITVLR